VLALMGSAPSTHPLHTEGGVGGPMSLYRAGLGLAPFRPLGVAIVCFSTQAGFADVSPVVT